MKKEGVLIIISGPSGSGKGTICKALLDEVKEMKLSISATTRNPRQGEIEGINYFFKSKPDFERLIAEDKMLEWAEFCGNYYGTPKEYVEDQLQLGHDVILEIEVQGALEVQRKYKKGIYIFVIPPNMVELKARLVQRDTETDEVIQKRLDRALEEIELAKHYDYIVVNDILDEAVNNIKSIVKAEKSKYSYQAQIFDEFKGGN